ncbi:MAG: GGDEF domain-containing protein [Tenericutes bacterium]|nr:GGDEF domain-containing protein [Mycoplasmatota bacterium]
MVIQSFHNGFFFTWNSMVLSLLVIYIFLESTSVEKDYLTKLFSRQSYEKYVSHIIGTEKPFSILFIDLDKFKTINDKLGHFVGDKVLVEFGRTLVKVFRPNHMVSRLGGDEFLVVIENVLVIKESIEAIYKLLSKHEDEAISTLEFSYGYQQYEKNMTIDELYIKADRKMYEHKEKKR